MKLRKNNPTGIMIHCSDSTFGDEDFIYYIHVLQNRWKDIGYNWLILNGFPEFKNYKNNVFIKSQDGLIVPCRDVKYQGAHASGYNDTHLGICLIGKWHFTFNQFLSLAKLLKQIQESNVVDYFIPGSTISEGNILGHYEVDSNKTCPNIDMNDLRLYLNNTP